MELKEWIDAWTRLAEYPGPHLVDVEARVASLLDLCSVPIDPSWPRPFPEDELWAGAPYRRGDLDRPKPPERTIEQQILGVGEHMARGRRCFGGEVIDAINAIALTETPKIEADVLLLVNHGHERRLYLAEVKNRSNNAWYATVELLRQMRLFTASTHAADYFHRKDAQIPAALPLTGLVLAPRDYYATTGKKTNAVDPSRQLIAAVKSHGLDVRLATWTIDATTGCIAELESQAVHS